MDLASLTSEQRRALDSVRAGKNTVVAGAAGSGKTAWIRAVKEQCPHCVVTATTGLAAVNAGGVTIHKFAGIGIADPGPNALAAATPADFVRIALEHIGRKVRPDIRRTISRTPLLLIEEASMLSEYLYRLLDGLFRLIRHDRLRPFGGMQIVLVGDMRQLAPVAKNRDHPMMGRFFFEAPGFDATFNGGVHVLTRIFRQQSASLRALLNRAAVGALSDADVETLRGRLMGPDLQPPVTATRLYGRKDTVGCYNSAYLAQLKAEPKVFRMKVTRSQGAGAAQEQWAVSNCIADKEITLKEGALTMLLWNVSPGFANGTVGYVIGYSKDGWPMFQPKEAFGKTDMVSVHQVIEVKPVRWEVVDHAFGTIHMDQVPLKPAYAMTIHKAQGIQVDEAVLAIDRQNCFQEGQAYVALSRLTTLEGMYLTAFDPAAVRASPAAIAFYRKYGDDGIGRELGGEVQEGDEDDLEAAAPAPVALDDMSVPPPSYEEATGGAVVS